MLPRRMFLFGEIHVFLQVNGISLFVTKGACLQLENSDLQEVFL
jgi:hypothetical protein